MIEFCGKNRIGLEAWEDGQLMITLNAKPVGMAVHPKEGNVIFNWLKHSILEIDSAISKEDALAEQTEALRQSTNQLERQLTDMDDEFDNLRDDIDQLLEDFQNKLRQR